MTIKRILGLLSVGLYALPFLVAIAVGCLLVVLDEV